MKATLTVLTPAQVECLQKIEIVHQLWVERILKEYPDCKPSQWTNVLTLVRVHKQRRGTIDALVRKGYLEERASDGQGQEVRRVRHAS